MLKSFCIKTNNKKLIDYLLNEFEKTNLNNLYISKLKFKFYNNIIVHYSKKDLSNFYNVFSNILSSAILNFYEKNIVKQLIDSNYFYFNDIEQQQIFEIANNYLYNSDLAEAQIRKGLIKDSLIEYFSNNKSAILDGLVKFRLKEYIKTIDYIVDLAVNKFVIDKEYKEFIELLKCYIDSKNCKCNTIHLIYQNQESILLDEFKNQINLDNNVLNNKYLSDISFSSNDYALNCLLTLLPKKIYIHLIDKTDDEFINTLKLIFNNRIYICDNCNTCKIYKLKKVNK